MRAAHSGALSGTLWSSRETSFEIWHLVPIILSIRLFNIYSHGRRDHVCGMCFLYRTWPSREYENPPGSHRGDDEQKNPKQKHIFKKRVRSRQSGCDLVNLRLWGSTGTHNPLVSAEFHELQTLVSFNRAQTNLLSGKLCECLFRLNCSAAGHRQNCSADQLGLISTCVTVVLLGALEGSYSTVIHTK